MIRTLLCLVIGHRPQVYEFDSTTEAGYDTSTYYVECARCARRKNLDGRGWIW